MAGDDRKAWADMTKQERLKAQKASMVRKVDAVIASVQDGRATGKRRPVLERIASLQGRTCFVEGGGFGGLPALTDGDVAAALAIIRKWPKELRHDIAPELLETYYGSTIRHRALLRSAYLESHPVGEQTRIPCRRLAATLAVQLLAGVPITRSQQAEYAFIAHTRLETMRREIEWALAWFEGIARAAASRMREVLASVEIVQIEKAQAAAGRRLEVWREDRKAREAREQAEAKKRAQGSVA